MTEPNAALVGRDELRSTIGGFVEAYTGYHKVDGYISWSMNVGHTNQVCADIDGMIEQIVQLVTAARDAEIRELLLSDEAVNAAEVGYINTDVRNYGYYDTPDGNWGQTEYERDAHRNALESALDHIGLHGDGTGGQG